MKILIDLTSLADNFSGIERYALNISKQMIVNNNENEYILFFKNKIHEEFTEFTNCENIEYKIIHGNNRLVFNQLILPYELYKINADKYLFLAFPSPIIFRKKGIINTIHDLTCWDYPETMKKSSKIYFQKSITNAIKVSEKIITVSKFSKKRIEEKFGNKNVYIVYNGVSDVFIKSFNEKKKLENDIFVRYNLPKKYIMCLCTLEPRKNIKLLVDAYIELRKENKITLNLVLVGRKGWKVENLLNTIQEKYRKGIVVTGFVDDNDLPQIYKNAEMFIFPSLYEGFGIPVIEAMFMNIPVICSNTSALPEVICCNKLLFENNNKSDLKDKILSLINMEIEEVDTIKLLGKEKANKFKWSNESIKLSDFLKNKLGEY